MNITERLTEKVLAGEMITRDEALELYETAPLEALCEAADGIRRHFCGAVFDLCTIINGKSGRCSENCKFCAQSSYYRTESPTYSLLGDEEILEQARYNDERGVKRYSIVTSGRALTDDELSSVCDSVREIRKHSKLSVCVSLGLLTESQFARLRDAGVTRVHNNVETSERNFPNVCTTHTFEDKKEAIRAAKRAGLNVCSGGIVGMGETPEDRIDMALSIRSMGVKSVPVNLLNPIPGTPYEDLPVLSVDEMRRIVAVYRFLIPDASIRLAGGRGLMPDKGRACFQSGANAAISGDMLTTAGITIETDLKMLAELGYEPGLWDERSAEENRAEERRIAGAESSRNGSMTDAKKIRHPLKEVVA